MDNDDQFKGRILTRREALAIMGGAGATFLLGIPVLGITNKNVSNGATAATDNKSNARSCIARPELTEGPYFVDEHLNRSNICSDPVSGAIKAGIPLEIILNISKIGDACDPLEGAMVDIWHCDASGLYSDVASDRTGDQKFLRGYQTTDSAGVVKFQTIYPGWYRGRAVHIHFKIRTPVGKETHDFTSQFFFDDAVSDKIYTKAPYVTNGLSEMKNAQDGIFQEGGKELVLDLKPSGAGYTTTFNVALDLTKPSNQNGGRGGGRGRQRPPSIFGRWGD